MASCLFATDIKQEPHHTFSFAWGCSLRRSLLILVFTLLLSLFIALVWENSELLWTCLVQTDFLNPEVLKALLANSCQCPLLSLSCQLVYQSWRALKDYRFWNIVTWIVALSEFHQHCTLHFGLSIRWLRLVIWLSGAWVRKLHISTSNTWHLTSNRHPTQLSKQAEIHVTFCIWHLWYHLTSSTSTPGWKTNQENRVEQSSYILAL